MELEVRRPEHIVPSYSLTGDLLSYLRCRLQYRYHNGSSLPPSRPVQIWYGEFLHGTLEMSYRFWKEIREQGRTPPDFPWPCRKRTWRDDPPDWEEHDIGNFANSVEEALRSQGKQARSTAARDSAYQRIEASVNVFGPHLFPLIDSAERKVIGTRSVPECDIDLRCKNYEVHGIIDVLTNVTLARGPDNNLVRQHVLNSCPNLTGTFEVIVDYKGTRRPLRDEPGWEQGARQIQTYAWLRQRQPDSLPVAAGILFYINELTPGDAEMTALQQGIERGTSDVVPTADSLDEQIVRMWRSGMDASQLSLSFRLRRAIRVSQITSNSIKTALREFDQVVLRIEKDIVAEAIGGDILSAWAPNSQDEGTCAACDFRHFCPSPAHAPHNYVIRAPTAP